jgi:acetyltransferase-like isoleucine patch superfamily enzyme
MGIFFHLELVRRRWRNRLARQILAHRVQYHNPTLVCHDTAIWDYAYADLDCIQLGRNVTVGPRAEILVYRNSRRSSVEGRLIVGNDAVIAAGAHIRAAGGTIRMGNGSGVAQYCILLAANHKVARGLAYLATSWDESKTGVDIGNNVWIAAGSVVLPGSRIGDNAVIGAGSVVRGEIPANEIWAGVPARKIKDVPADEATTLPGQSARSSSPRG